jgi:hypothetical protein
VHIETGNKRQHIPDEVTGVNRRSVAIVAIVAIINTIVVGAIIDQASIVLAVEVTLEVIA